MRNKSPVAESATETVMLDEVTEAMQIERFPATKREFFLRLAEAEGDLSKLMKAVAWADVKPHMIYSAVLGRMPEIPIVDSEFDAQRAFRDATTSEEFRLTVIEDLLNAFPEKKRLIFVHIPKTAGTSLEIHLSRRAAFISNFFESRQLYTEQLFFTEIANLIKKLKSSDHIVVGGHIPLLWFLDHNLIRANDTVFTVVRDPVDLQISFANYAAMVMIDDPNVERQDTREWLDQIEISADALKLLDQEDVARRVLFRYPVFHHNMLCRYLGDGDFASSYQALRRCDVKISLFSEFNEWLQKAWKIPNNTTFENRSKPFIRYNNLSFQDRRVLSERCIHDRILFKTISYLKPDNKLSRSSLDLPPLVVE